MPYHFKNYLEELSKRCYEVIADHSADKDLIDENKTLLLKLTDAEEVYESFLSINEKHVVETLSATEDRDDALYSTFAVWLLAEQKKQGKLDLDDSSDEITSLLAGVQPIEIKQGDFIENAFEIVCMFERELLHVES
ncbi:hypothetical protein [Piscirickettsia litoralis]|uniref:Uncharacterized protein n=1 Tax=Piscirickettsia litoralis TaxID=1891921 RepID=A0ABX3A806_9GAMM|nr:hypothetical protein [Piscirickettsia litoralis]ODN42239.1 hypothetical protein BGC07_03925 [Piscirickettsia litoralis]